MYGLPLDLMTTTNVTMIAHMIGRGVEIVNPKVDGQLLRAFVRARVEVNIRHPLPTCFWVLRRTFQKYGLSFSNNKIDYYQNIFRTRLSQMIKNYKPFPNSICTSNKFKSTTLTKKPTTQDKKGDILLQYKCSNAYEKKAGPKRLTPCH